MNFKTFIIKEDVSPKELEQFTFEELKPLIQKDCSKFLKESKGDLLFRGLGSKIRYLLDMMDYPRIIKLKALEDRLPRNSPIDFHNIFNLAFKRIYWIENIRSQATFVTGSEHDAESYGEVYTIFPIGNYTYWWSPYISDSYINMSSLKPFNEENPNNVKRIQQFIEEGDYRDLNLNKAIKSGHEIMLLCKEYYAIKFESNLDVYKLFD